MIRALLALLPEGSTGLVTRHLVLSTAGVLLRAVGCVLLVPLVAALFGPDPATAWPWLGLLAAATALGAVVDAVAARLGYRLGFGILANGQLTVAERITGIRLTWFTAEHTATTRQAVAATGPDLVGIIVYFVTPLLSAVLLPVVIALALLLVAPALGVAALAGIVVLAAALLVSDRLTRAAERESAAANNRVTERVLEFARTQQALRAARRVEPARSHAGAALDAARGATWRYLLLQLPGQLLVGVVSQLVLIGLVATTVVLVVRGRIGVPEAIALVVVIVRYLESFTVVAELSPGIGATTGTLRRIREVLQAPQDPAGQAQAEVTGAPRLELRGVGFGYSDEPVLEDLDLVLEPGRTTAIVGPSGSGKSTVLALLAGLLQPDQGHVLVAGQDLASLDAASRRKLVSFVFQQPYLFEASLRENVLVGDPGAGAERIEEVARLAGVDGIVTRLPGGWDSRVGEAGGTLSGGERQRVTIARALLKPAPVLLLDEATSALDSENEKAVAAALTGDPVARTRVIVAHRLSSIRAADRVVFLEEGRVVEDGTLPELLALQGRFARFWHQQQAAGGWRLRVDPPLTQEHDRT